MGITVATTRVACNVGAGDQTITTVDLGGLTPKAALFIVSYCITDATPAVDAVLSYGACTGVSNRWVIGGFDEDAQGTSDTFTWYATDEVIQIYDPSDGTLEAEADFSAWVANGVTVNWASAPDAAYLLTVIFFAGTDLSVFAEGGVNLGNTVDLETNVVAPGFQPDVLLTACATGLGAPGSGANWKNSFGFVHYDGVSTYTQRCISNYWRHNRATSDVGMAGRNDACITELFVGSFDWWGEVDDFDADGFSIWTRNNGGNNRDLCYLALSFGGAVDSWVGTHTTPDAGDGVGNWSDVGPGFKPQAVIALVSLIEAYTTAYTDNRGGSFGASVFDADDEYTNIISSEDNVATTNTQSLSDARAIVVPDDDGTLDIEADFVSFDANGWTVDYTNVPVTAKLFPALAIEESAASTTSTSTTTTTSTSTSTSTTTTSTSSSTSTTTTLTTTSTSSSTSTTTTSTSTSSSTSTTTTSTSTSSSTSTSTTTTSTSTSSSTSTSTTTTSTSTSSSTSTTTTSTSTSSSTSTTTTSTSTSSSTSTSTTTTSTSTSSSTSTSTTTTSTSTSTTTTTSTSTSTTTTSTSSSTSTTTTLTSTSTSTTTTSTSTSSTTSSSTSTSTTTTSTSTSSSTSTSTTTTSTSTSSSTSTTTTSTSTSTTTSTSTSTTTTSTSTSTTTSSSTSTSTTTTTLTTTSTSTSTTTTSTSTSTTTSTSTSTSTTTTSTSTSTTTLAFVATVCTFKVWTQDPLPG